MLQRALVVLIFLILGLLFMPDEASPSSRSSSSPATPNKLAANNVFAIPWGRSWKNRTQVEDAQCLHLVDRKDFIGFKSVLKFCRLKKNIFQIKMKQKVVPRWMTRHLVEWSIAARKSTTP